MSNNGKYSVSPFEDTSWLYEEEGNMNSSYRTHRWTQNPYPREAVQRWELKPPKSAGRSRAPSGGGLDDLDSGLDSVSVVTNRTEVAEERVAALEQELATLKEMMASIALQSMPQAASTPAKPPSPRTPAMAPPPAPPAPKAPTAPAFKPSVPPSQKTKKMQEIQEVMVPLMFSTFLLKYAMLCTFYQSTLAG